MIDPEEEELRSSSRPSFEKASAPARFFSSKPRQAGRASRSRQSFARSSIAPCAPPRARSRCRDVAPRARREKREAARARPPRPTRLRLFVELPEAAPSRHTEPRPRGPRRARAHGRQARPRRVRRRRRVSTGPSQDPTSRRPARARGDMINLSLDPEGGSPASPKIERRAGALASSGIGGGGGGGGGSPTSGATPGVGGGFPSPPVLRGVVLKLRELQPEMVLSPRTVQARATAPGGLEYARKHAPDVAERIVGDAVHLEGSTADGGSRRRSSSELHAERTESSQAPRPAPGAKSRSAGRKGVTRKVSRVRIGAAGEEAKPAKRDPNSQQQPSLHFAKDFRSRRFSVSHERPRLEKQQRVVMRGYALPCSQMLFSCLIT